jgi:hypothetical protein
MFWAEVLQRGFAQLDRVHDYYQEKKELFSLKISGLNT